MNLLNKIFNPKQKQNGNQDTKPPSVWRVNNLLIFQGSKTLQLSALYGQTIAEEFKKLLSLHRSSNTLASEYSIQQLKYLIDYHPYGKKAASIYKSFCTNDIDLEGNISKKVKKEIKDFLSNLIPRTGSSGLSALEIYLVKAILLQGGVAFWLDVDAELNMRLIDIPFNTIASIFDKTTNQWKYRTNRINLSAINENLPENEKFKFESDLPQFQLHFFDIDLDSNQPIPFFSAAIEDIYTETLWRRLIREVVNKLAILKHGHFKLKEPASKPVGAMNLFDDIPENDSETKKAAEEIKNQIAQPTGKVVNNPETNKNYAFLASTSITDENVDITTYSTLETQAIKPIQDAVEKPLPAGLRVPAQFLGLSQSRTETQFGIDVELFLEQEGELRSFIASILTSLVEFRAVLLNQSLPEDFQIQIIESEVVRSVQRMEAEKKKADLQTVQLANLKLKKELGYEIKDEELVSIGYKAVKSNSTDANFQNAAPKPNQGVAA